MRASVIYQLTATILLGWIGQGFAQSSGSWTYEPDPGPAIVRVAPAAVQRVQGGKASHSAVFASLPSPFVLTTAGDSRQPVARVWDLQSGDTTRGFSIDATNLMHARLSPDGRLLAGSQFAGGYYYSTIWDTSSGEIVWQESPADLEDIKRVKARVRDFVGDDLLMLHGDQHVRIVNFRDGSVTREFECQSRCSDVPLSVLSFGRNYIARLESNRIRLYDLRTGTLSGSVTIAKYEGASTQPVKSLCFSSDGTEFAALLNVSRRIEGRLQGHQGIVSWSSDGKLVTQLELNQQAKDALMAMGNYQENLDFLPDGSGWFVDNGGIVDRASGEVTWLVPAQQFQVRRSTGPNQFLDRGQVLLHLGPGTPVLAIAATNRSWSAPRPAPGDRRAAREERATPKTDDARPSSDMPSTRIWTDVSGKFRLRAAFVKLEDGQVHLQKTDGTTSIVPLDRLSSADRAIARRLEARE